MSDSKSARIPLLASGLGAVLASVCCLGPLVLLTLGVSGAWIGNLAALEPYRPLFITAAVIALFFAYRRLFCQPGGCEPGEMCSAPQIGMAYKVLFWLVALLVAVAMVFPYAMPLFY